MNDPEPGAQDSSALAVQGQDAPTVLVAGATGYIGRHIVEAVHDAGYRVRALARDEGKLEPVADACDEVFIGEATNIDSLDGVCDGVDAVVSSLGLRTLRRRPSPEEVDLHANLNVLKHAQAAGVEHFIFVGVLGGDQLMTSTPILRPRDEFISALIDSSLTWTVLRPTGSFNDMRELFGLAQRGWAFMLKDDRQRINPVHPADIAQMAVQSITDSALHNAQFGFGGPDVFAHREIADLAAQVLDRRLRSVRMPTWPLDAVGGPLSLLNRNAAGFLRFFRQVMSRDMVGTRIGDHHLIDFYAELGSSRR